MAAPPSRNYWMIEKIEKPGGIVQLTGLVFDVRRGVWRIWQEGETKFRTLEAAIAYVGEWDLVVGVDVVISSYFF